MLFLFLRYLLNVFFFSRIRDLIVLLKYRGSLWSQNIVSREIKLLSIFNIVQYGVAEDRNTLVNISIEKGSIPTKISNFPSDKFSICLFIVPDFSWVWWWVIYLQIKFCEYNLMITICMQK